MTRPADLVEQPDAAGGRRFGRLQDGALVPYFTRAEIDAGALRRQRLDLLYLHSPIDLFFLQIQGSGRIDLPNGHVVRVGYAARNGQPYVPIGRALVAQGALAADDVSAGSIRAWLIAHPLEAAGVMELNPSYTFFRELPDLSLDQGPVGALGVQLQPLRSIAVDTRHLAVGRPCVGGNHECRRFAAASTDAGAGYRQCAGWCGKSRHLLWLGRRGRGRCGPHAESRAGVAAAATRRTRCHACGLITDARRHRQWIGTHG